ncbi:hypothetical protein MAR_021719 [Mya arenaria]|uniref:Uncharacterized protein n=1 Tax=Mya arenaria TaxID=6604 RepID=A0ABY7E8J7_MYAAR|nr:hypothetical protein MAR_021719 [Mya arenaria]
MYSGAVVAENAELKQFAKTTVAKKDADVVHHAVHGVVDYAQQHVSVVTDADVVHHAVHGVVDYAQQHVSVVTVRLPSPTLSGDEDDDENPQHGMSNKKRGRTAAASNTVPISGSAVSRNDIYPHLNETASEKPLRQQPLPPVGGQKGHGRGLSANFGDNNDTMPAVDTKRLPPVMDRNEDTEVKKKKKKKKKNKEKREQD